MKTLMILAVTMIFAISLSAQNKVPTVMVKLTDGTVFSTNDIKNDGKPVIIDFWATWCKPCVKELDAIAEEFEDLKAETGVKMYAVSIDDSRTVSKVAPFANTKDWPYTILCDQNSDLKRALNVVNVPHTFVLDGEGNIVWQHAGYSEGDEKELFEVVKKLAAGEKITH